MSAIPQKLIGFLEENKSKPREDVIKNMMLKFNYKKSTASTYYSIYYCTTDVRAKIFSFLEENPETLRNNVIERYAEKLGVTKITYLKYKGEYMIENNIEAPRNKVNEIEYYKGRAREKFQFDDSRLFG